MPFTVATVGTALTAAEKVDKGLGLISKYLDTFKSHPDVAAQKLAQALEEIAKTYQVVDTAFSAYLSLGIDDAALEKNSKPLLAIEGGALNIDVERGRGHCTAIKHIHDTYLNKWFARVFQSAQGEYDQVQSVFYALAYADEDLFEYFVTVVKALQEEATAALDLVVAGKTQEARQRILSSRPALGPLRRTISQTMQQLYRLKGEFIQIAQVA